VAILPSSGCSIFRERSSFVLPFNVISNLKVLSIALSKYCSNWAISVCTIVDPLRVANDSVAGVIVRLSVTTTAPMFLVNAGVLYSIVYSHASLGAISITYLSAGAISNESMKLSF
jgi:hypothetical protein